MAKSQMKVAHIVASSTEAAWSQTYHAGGVTAIVSVQPKKTDSQSLSIVGKDLLNTFESEYFTLETKNLASIKGAVETTYNKSKDTHEISLIVSAVIQNAVYVVLAGKGKVLLVRSNTLATLLEQTDSEEVLSASGFLEPDDVMILETLPFAEKVPSSTLLETLTTNTVEDAAEILSPTIHKDQTGAEAALLYSYHEETGSIPVSVPKPIQETPKQSFQEEISSSPHSVDNMPDSQREVPEPLHAGVMEHALPKRKNGLSHRQKIFLTLAVIIAIVFVGVIYFSLQKNKSNQDVALFSSLYPPAEQKYQEGIGLKDLNPTLARDDFSQAKSMLEGAKSKFPSNSTQEKQILALLDKVNTELSAPTPTPIPATEVTKANNSDDPYLAFIAKNTSAKYFTADDTNYYYADSTGVTKVTKSSSKSTQVIKNSGDYQLLGGFQTYLGNIYIVDTTDGIDKYAGTAAGFGSKTAYFSGTTPDLSKVVSMAIDGSIWLLTSDGKVSQYTKGKADAFTISGLKQSLSSPTQIVTSVDDDNLYILDTSNARIVVIKKDTGAFVAQYHNDILKTATQIDVTEKTKTAFILSGGTIYKMSLK